MSVILTNGSTYIVMRNADFQVLQVPPWQTPQKLIENSVGLPRSYNISGGRSTRILQCEVSLYGDDKATTAQGLDTLMAFYENTDYTGVDGMARSWMLTDADGVSYQVRFADDLAGGLREGPTNQFSGSITLINEHSLPTDEANCEMWLAAYDLDGNGGDMSAWTGGDDVGGSGETWIDRSPNASAAVQSTAGQRPLIREPSDGGAINNRYAMNFDGTDDRLTINSVSTVFDTVADSAWSAYAVVRVDTFPGSGSETIFGLGKQAANSDRLHFLNVAAIGGGANPEYEVFIDDGSSSASANTTGSTGVTGTGVILSMICSGTTVDLYVNGTQKVTASSLNVGIINSDWCGIGAQNNAGTIGQFYDGKIGELSLFSEAHSTIQRRRQEFRLSDMFGITLTG